MKIHKLKSWPAFFNEIIEDKKRHDMRRNDDREFEIGDILLLQEWDNNIEAYTGKECEVKVTYITSEKFPCAWSPIALDSKFCILSIALQG